MEIFSALLALLREIHRHRWIPLTKASDVEIDAFFDLRLNKWLNTVETPVIW